MAQVSISRETISNIKNLPTLPEVASRLLQIINAPDTSATDVADLISKDIGITSKVLRMANSAFYGIPRTITTVQNAVVLLGMKVVNSLVLSVTVGNAFPPKEDPYGINRKSFWRHSLATAVCGRMLAQKVKSSHLMDPEECFCSGLLHDIGRLVLDQYFRDPFMKAIDLAKEKGVTLLQAESEIFDCNHTRIGDWLTSKWELPRDLRVPIITHHATESLASPDKHACIVHLADFITHQAGYDLYEGEVSPVLDPNVKDILEMSDNKIESMRESIKVEIAKLEVSFNFSGR